ncbi:MAG: hypothetical protein JWL72_1195, partial [Ilumatobacteraceae bacterium]|nr:hypothetical protein [Ilumatobacteraceae bacterium]
STEVAETDAPAGPTYSSQTVRYTNSDGWSFVFEPNFELTFAFFPDSSTSPPGKSSVQGIPAIGSDWQFTGDDPGRTPPTYPDLWIELKFPVTDPDLDNQLQQADSYFRPDDDGQSYVQFGNMAATGGTFGPSFIDIPETLADSVVDYLNSVEPIIDVKIGTCEVSYGPDGTTAKVSNGSEDCSVI